MSNEVPDELLISVIVPVYNVERYLDQCVKSIVEQGYRNLEIILVDDGSRDACPGKCDMWAAKDNRISVIHKANGGLSSARNAGLDQARLYRFRGQRRLDRPKHAAYHVAVDAGTT